MSGNIDRIEAHKDMRSIAVAVGAQSKEGADQCRERLELEAGSIVKVKQLPRDVQRDEAGFNELRELARTM